MAFPSSWNSGVKSATTRVKGLHAPCRTFASAFLASLLGASKLYNTERASSLGAFQKNFEVTLEHFSSRTQLAIHTQWA